MKDLGKWQIISFMSRGMATVLGLVQSYVIIRILSVSDWGLAQLAASIGGALGIYQHLGLASASTREISSAKDNSDIFKIFVTSAAIRYVVTLPIAFALFFFSKNIAVSLYQNEALIIPLKIYAVALLFQGFQSILNSVISGTKRFKQLFLYQIGVAFLSVALYIPLVFFFKVNGYFYAFLSFNILNTFLLSVLALKPLRGFLAFPSKADFMRLFKEIFSISMAIYLVKVIYTNWEKMGSNVLGLFNSTEVVAIYAFALLYAKKLMTISDSITDVSLPVLSEKYEKDINEFKLVFSKNFDKIFFIVLIVGVFASYWAPEVTTFLVGSDKYASSYSLIPPMILAFILYSYINVVKSSVLIPAKMTWDMILTFVFMIIGTIVFFFGSNLFLPILPSMAWGMVFGSLVSLLFMFLRIKARLNFNFINIDHLGVFAQGAAIAFLAGVPSILLKSAMFPIFACLLTYGAYEARFINKDDFAGVKDKFLLLRKKFK